MKKFSNKILIIVLVALVAIFALSRIFRSPKLESNLRKELVKIDTAAVTEVRINREADGGGEVRLKRDGNTWKVTTDNKEAEAGVGAVKSMLGVMKDLQAQRMVARKKEKWDSYQVGESSTRVTAYNGSEKLADFRVGKTGFSQGQGGGQGSAYTYLRLTDEDEVYSSEGFITSHFNRSFDDWRNQMFLKTNRDDVTKIEFNYPDSSFVLEKRDSLWYVGSEPAIETKVNQYFSKIRVKTISEFDDNFVPPANATLRIQISGAGPLATAQAWAMDDENWVLNSTVQQGVYFKGKRSGVLKDIFVGKGWFIE
ncbi:MAG TPA: DUF4340 domain-containing protein [Cyclobacteriaceae bacterium]|nr:DUF4340 domain-containing protein [Cyclobacteriaceae bacterium]